MDKLVGKKALVTGGGQGIGRGIALALAAEGASVAVLGRTAEKVEQTAAEIEERGGRALAITGDVKVDSDVSKAVETVVGHFGGLDILVNNAQEYGFGPILYLDFDELEAGWQSGALGTLRFMRESHSHLREGGLIVNVSSSAASGPDPANAGGYAAVKSAIATLSRAAAVEWAQDGIRVMTLIPFARTPAVQAAIDSYEGLEEQILSDVPLGRFGDPEKDIGRTVAFLASEDGAFLTGSSVALDGGTSYLT